MIAERDKAALLRDKIEEEEKVEEFRCGESEQEVRDSET